MNWPGWRCASATARAWRVSGRIKSVEWQAQLRHVQQSGFVLTRVMVTLGAKARLRISELLVVSIAQALLAAFVGIPIKPAA